MSFITCLAIMMAFVTVTIVPLGIYCDPRFTQFYLPRQLRRLEKLVGQRANWQVYCHSEQLMLASWWIPGDDSRWMNVAWEAWNTESQDNLVYYYELVTPGSNFPVMVGEAVWRVGSRRDHRRMRQSLAAEIRRVLRRRPTAPQHLPAPSPLGN